MLLETDRLILRRFTPRDFDDWVPLDEDPRVMKYIQACKPKPRSREEAESRFEFILSYYDRYPGLGVFATCRGSDDALIGWTALKDLDETELIEIGYRYFTDYWGMGYATEAAGALVQYGFEQLGLEVISAVTHPEHSASKRVLSKLGFRHLRKDVFYDTDVDYFERKRYHA